MTRRLMALICVGALSALVAWDVAASPPNPYRAPPALAWGSGSVAAGGFCGALPK